ncbi:hypothetical protein BgAZ_103780 [Babesia gibsoni]|uniref:30S ribosomal protein S15 n=1 Tax=Babesia gibsoni TaxID=33632 RepID=A0AAD8PFS5_BABGI|nr:hypothetical protein BgAZ_103780 [Babesia gibsoni]
MRWFSLCVKLCFVYSLLCTLEGYKIRFGRERSRILKLRKRKSAFVDRLNLLTKTRGIGIFTLQAAPDEVTTDTEVVKDTTDRKSFEEYLPAKKKKKVPKNPFVNQDLDRFDPVFKKIPSLRHVKQDVRREDRPGGLNPLGYASHYIPEGEWSFHPRLLRVRGKYFSRLYEKELRDPFKMHENDTGSSQVQIAQLTAKIDYLSRHVLKNHKDVQARLQIIRLANRRRRLLGYLYRTNRPEFDKLIDTFGIDFEDAPFSYKKLLPRYSHMNHKRTKRYSTAKEQREAIRQRSTSTANKEVL